jgi:hypothetical protein
VLIGQNRIVSTVLVSLPGGEGVVRACDGATLITDDVTGGGGVCLRDEDPYHPVKTWVDPERSLVAGLLPPRAVGAEVVDDRGTRVSAVVGHGAYVAIIEQANDGHEPIVCCRDDAGHPVCRPLPDEYPRVLVTDADEPCPACGATDYAEYMPTEQWRSGSGGLDGVIIPNPVVACRVCGHEEPEGSFHAVYSEASEDDAVHEARPARARADARVRQWYSNALTLRAVTFPIYAAEGWAALISGSGSHGDHLTELTVSHYDTPNDDPYSQNLPRLKITTSREDSYPADGLQDARRALEAWIHNDGRHARWPSGSYAAMTLWLRARDRARRAEVLAATRSEQPIALEGAPASFLVLTARDGSWVAVRRHEDLIITIAARDLTPETIAIEPIADPAVRLLGSKPEEP